MKFDLTGQRFGRLTAVSFHGMTGAKSRHYKWTCRCDCGDAKVVDATHLRSGDVQSCGCLRRERISARRTSHGATRGYKPTKEYVAWRSMLQRCDDAKCKSYPYYGGRGITVCDRWRQFENFLADMGKRPRGMSIERKDNDGNYEPGNCKWATRSEQARNTRRTVHVTVAGRTMRLRTACEERGLSYNMVRQRLQTYGWSVERALGSSP